MNTPYPFQVGQQAMNVMASHVTIAQGPVKPWETDEEAAEYTDDARAYLLKKCKPFMDSISMATNHLMIATYYCPEFSIIKGKDGPVKFYVGDKTTDEATWQSRCGLLIAKGPLCWKNDDRNDFGGTNYEVGDWVCFDRQDGRQISINRVHCRRLRDIDIWGKVDNPLRVF